ncbi:MAG TPA: ATPase domain-containing protein [Thermoanaerobaculia bacterium]|nr:ATPase domain-containing protein [Thermoanaerobaculia bacterium]
MKGSGLAPSNPARNALHAILRGSPLLDGFTLQTGLALLLLGSPGAGKTTLGLHLLHQFYLELSSRRDSTAEPITTLLLSLVEKPEQINHICDLYGFTFTPGEEAAAYLVPARFRIGKSEGPQEIAAQYGLTLREGDLLFVDGLSVLGPDPESRKSLFAFLEQIKALRLVAILVAEEHRQTEDISLKYAVDGIIRVKLDPLARSRSFEIEKLRWHDYYLGNHAFRLQAVDPPEGRAELRIFPSIACLIGQRPSSTRLASPGGEQGSTSQPRSVPSGVEGFDELFDTKQGPFGAGEQVLLLGPSGSGKFLFGTQFLSAATEGERSVYVSFGRKPEDVQSRRERLGRAAQSWDCLHFGLTDLIPEEALGTLVTVLERDESKLTRVFIDGWAALHHTFGHGDKHSQFLTSFLELLAKFTNAIALISYTTPRVFSSYSELDLPASEAFSTIVGFNFQEQYNHLVPGIVVLKSRGRNFDTGLKVPTQRDGRYAIDLKAGWPRVGLLGGEREQVREELPFVKLFFENRSEHEVLEGPFEDFRGRYPNNFVFRMVPKENPQPSHWSFQGYAGTGHSNLKLVELRHYVMEELRDRGVFLEVPVDIIERSGDRFDSGFLWTDRAQHKPHSSNEPKYLVPFYADVGVLVHQPGGEQGKVGASLAGTSPPRTWADLLELIPQFEPSGEIRHLFVIPNTVTDAKQFVSFFFELCWTFGWAPAVDWLKLSQEETHKALCDWLRDPAFRAAADLLCQMVHLSGAHAKAADKAAVPNPNRGGLYHESVFARRWFSKVQLLPSGIQRRHEAKRHPLGFHITQLPGTDVECPGISNVDLYSLGIVRAALVPETGWMLVSSLLSSEVDVRRARQKRGLPVSRRLFRTNQIQSELDLAPVEPEKARGFYDAESEVFSDYSKTLNAILDPKEGSEPKFRRAADILRFFDLERLLARTLPRLFDAPPAPLESIQETILAGLTSIYLPAGEGER